MRELPIVLEQIIKEIPEGEGLKRQLSSVLNSAYYCPPESMGSLWHKTILILIAFDDKPENFTPNSWQEKIHKIWMNKQ